MLFRLNTPLLTLAVALVVGGTTGAGIVTGRAIRARKDQVREPLSTVQAALLGFIGLLLAFGLTMAVGRYGDRRQALVHEANTIGTTYLRAQVLPEPARTDALGLLRRYTDLRIALSDQVPGSGAYRRTRDESAALHRQLWAQVGPLLRAQPEDTGPRLYVESLNEMIDADASRAATLADRVPASVVYLQLFGGAVALGALATYLAVVGQGTATSAIAAAVVVLILLVTIDLDRPVRGAIRVPATALVEVRTSMDLPPATS